MKTPGISIPFVSQGSREAVLSDIVGIPITIDGTRLGSLLQKTKISAPYLYARTTASPYKAKPFQNAAVIINPTNSTNATVDVADADAIKFRAADVCTYVNQTTGAISSETKTVTSVGAAGSGGAGETIITFTGTWTTAPSAGNLLVVADGTHLSANALIVLEDIEFDGTNDIIATGYVSGLFRKAAVSNIALFDNTKQANLQLVDIQ